MDSKQIYKKLKLASDLFAMAVKIKTHQLQKKFPTASHEEVRQKALELFFSRCQFEISN